MSVAIPEETAADHSPSQQATSIAVDKPFTFHSKVDFPSPEAAKIVKSSLDVDPELRPSLVTRQLAVEGSSLIIDFRAVDARTLRAAVGTFCDLLGIAIRTLEAFG